MPDLEAIAVKGSDFGEFCRSYTAAMQSLPRDLFDRLSDIRSSYFGRFGFDGAYERLNGRTVAQILAEYLPGEPVVIAEGQVGGLTYRLMERPSDAEPQVRPTDE